MLNESIGARPRLRTLVVSGGILIGAPGILGLLFLTLFARYEPVLFACQQGDHRFVERPDLQCAEHLGAMRKVLSQYGRFHFTIRGQLFIRRSLAKDKETLANYCQKAEGLRESPGP